MLGFSPIASATLADDGGVIEYELLGSNVTSGAPAVANSSITQKHVLNLTAIATAKPTVPSVSMYERETFGGVSITAGSPTVANSSITQKHVLGLSPGTVATDMQRTIKDSGVSHVARLDWSVHIPPEWPAEALIWMCGPDADEFLGKDVSLREEGIRKRVGLI